jgi:hypothetical protein
MENLDGGEALEITGFRLWAECTLDDFPIFQNNMAIAEARKEIARK